MLASSVVDRVMVSMLASSVVDHVMVSMLASSGRSWV